MSEKKLMRDTFQRLFTPMQIERKIIHYEFIIKSKTHKYDVRYTKRSGEIRWLAKGRGWLVSKRSIKNPFYPPKSQKMSKDERQMIIDYCKQHLVELE